ncbi:LCP family protein [Neobacillus terrae]|uniref:LCP family protein n=1 Tax=Neobacillus terrae TaxID=3034837 RepID=UPI001408388A|nr:LCP family protein [Neobacillus terrae]NHM31715.1 LCP family protein [Neobacillus terrae]
MRSERHENKGKKKRKAWKVILLLLLLIIGCVLAYAYYQYKQGINQSMKKIGGTTKLETYKFEGQKDQYGNTNILLMGSDARGKERSRSDTIMIASYNQDKGTYKLTSIMRDSYVEIPGYGKHKINSAFASGGPELMRQTIKENFDIDLQYYAILDFEGFVQVIDEAFPNGVEINVEKKMAAYVDPPLEPGLQKLDGRHLLSYVRFRHDRIGDFGRVQRQQEVIQKLGEQMTSFTVIPKLPKLIGIISPYINTNMQSTDILFMAKNYFTQGKENIPTLRIPVDNSFTEPRISGEGAVLKIDVEKNKEALHQFISN